MIRGDTPWQVLKFAAIDSIKLYFEPIVKIWKWMRGA